MSDTALQETALRPGLLRERRLARMRLGQGVCEIFPLLSDGEVRVAVVMLNEAEHENCLAVAASIQAADNIAGNQLRDRTESLEILSYAIRDPLDLTKRIYTSGKQVAEDLEPADVGFLIERYYEMADTFSPSLERLSDEDQEQLKKVLQEMDWNALSGRQWYAASRFLLSLMPQPLGDSLLGYGSTPKSTTTND
jgi:hypothetical protein